MKLLLDQGLPRSTALLLRDVGLDVVHVGEIGFSTASDNAILQKAHDEDRIIVTLDADFHTLLALSGDTSPSVIRIRIEGLRGQMMANIIRSVLAQCREDLKTGALVTVQQSRIRIRRLPITQSVR